jgi:hypothetical protein
VLQNVGLLSEEEIASAGAMAVSMWEGGVGCTLVWKRRGIHPSGVEEVGAKLCERGGRDAGVQEMGPSYPDDMGSGAEGSDPKADTGCEAGVGSARILKTRTEQTGAYGHVQLSTRPSTGLSVFLIMANSYAAVPAHHNRCWHQQFGCAQISASVKNVPLGKSTIDAILHRCYTAFFFF